MYITVKLLKGYSEPLTYQVPESWDTQHLRGALVRVPLRNKTVAAVVLDAFEHFEKQPTFTIKYATAIEPMPHDPHYPSFIAQLSRYYQVDSLHLTRRIKQFLLQKETAAPTVNAQEHHEATTVTLTSEQQLVVDHVAPQITEQRYSATLLHGVTGSGKTEVYKKLITKTVLEQKKSALLLLPEVSLALAFERLLKKQLSSDLTIVSFHSATTVKEKRALWKHLLNKTPLLIVGVHLPVLLPISNLGLIIVDEEHDVGYQEKKHPRINSKEAALMRASITKIPALLGSATPSLTSLYNVKTRSWHFFELKKRFAGAFPTVEVVSLTDKKQRKNFWISQKLERAIAQRLHDREQTIIFINRRGYSFFVQCKQCSFIFQCNNCSVSLTLHGDGHLACHYCGLTKMLPATCPTCSSSELLKKGIGTQQAVTILQKFFPHARIERADMDSTLDKKKWQETMQGMQEGTIDILVGTQTITKGYHFPKVTLVGVLWADLNLNFPMFNAAETTLQQLIQVAGRAGRQSQESHVIVQTMTDHPVFTFLNEVNYPKFYEREIEHRSLLGYPPCKRLVEIALKHDDEQCVEQEAHLVVERLLQMVGKNAVQILGPAKPPVYKIQNSHTQKIYLKSESMGELIQLFEKVKKDDLHCSIFFTPNPLTM
jgi:primosomal protein N' (replication factor Y)